MIKGKHMIGGFVFYKHTYLVFSMPQCWSFNFLSFSQMGELLKLRERITKCYEGPAKSFVTGFRLLQCYVLSNIFLLQTFKVFPLY